MTTASQGTASPGFREPMLATLSDDVVSGPEWIFERKLDGIRIIAVRDGDDVALWTRNRKRRDATYPELVEALRAQPCRRFVVDGEVVAFDGDVTSFARLQQRSGISDAQDAKHSGVAVYLYLFDLLHTDGHDLDDVPLRERKSALRELVDFDDPLRFTPHRNAEGPAYLDDACRRGWEGLIAKRAGGRYVHGRSRDWLKLKCVARQELVIGGYTDPKGSRSGFGSLLVGYHDGEDLVYAGRVGTGFDEETLHRLHGTLSELETATSPFDRGDPAAKNVHWAAPELVCEVGFTEWTTDGKLRHPRFLGLRHDKNPADVVREVPRSAPG